jgi:hypothetical protein
MPDLQYNPEVVAEAFQVRLGTDTRNPGELLGTLPLKVRIWRKLPFPTRLANISVAAGHAVHAQQTVCSQTFHRTELAVSWQ